MGERWGLFSNLVGFVIRIRILMYPACILQDTRILMYLDVSQTYLTCSVTLQENTCILTFCMYFTRISNEFKIHVQDTHKIHQDTCILCASLMSLWIHINPTSPPLMV